MIAVALVLDRTTLGQMDRSTTRRVCSPRTRQYWSTTAIGSDSGPILQVPEVCWVVATFCISQASVASGHIGVGGRDAAFDQGTECAVLQHLQRETYRLPHASAVPLSLEVPVFKAGRCAGVG